MKSILSLAILMVALSLNAQKLEKFGADLGMKTVMGKEVRVPYTDVQRYFGYAKPGQPADETRDGKKFYYLYLWIPVAAPEIGVRMCSPVPEKMKPAEADFASASYTENAADVKNYFDTWITLERALTVVSVGDILTKGNATKWISYGVNDDSGEMPAQPSGSKYNSLFRVTSEVSNPEKALVMGLYRIGFTTYKKGEVQGTFLAEVGAPVKLPGVALAASLEDLVKAIEARKEKK
jgi:hypothetical protein